MFRKPAQSRLLRTIPTLTLAFAMVLTAGIAHAMFFTRPPANLDLSRSKPTQHALYVGTIEPGIDPIPVRRMHSWTVVLTTAQGKPVDEARITVSGGMPQHGHGLPTQPTVSPQANGRYLVEGVKFNMGGWWTVTLHIDGAAGADDVTFNLSL
jgi:hypothetical protein